MAAIPVYPLVTNYLIAADPHRHFNIFLCRLGRGKCLRLQKAGSNFTIYIQYRAIDQVR